MSECTEEVIIVICKAGLSGFNVQSLFFFWNFLTKLIKQYFLYLSFFSFHDNLSIPPSKCQSCDLAAILELLSANTDLIAVCTPASLKRRSRLDAFWWTNV